MSALGASRSVLLAILRFRLIKVCCVLKDFSLFKVSSFSEAHSTQAAFLLVLSGEEDSGVRRQCGMEGDD